MVCLAADLPGPAVILCLIQDEMFKVDVSKRTSMQAGAQTEKQVCLAWNCISVWLGLNREGWRYPTCRAKAL